MDKLTKLRELVIKASENPSFIHHKWYVKYHLNFVEKISIELCEIYKEADKEIVQCLVWVHDYGKILGIKELNSIVSKIELLLQSIGFDQSFIEKIIEYFIIFENKMEVDLHKVPLEIKIISSADGAAHLVGPFFSIYWYENPQREIKEIMEGNRNKLQKDWERKIVLPEVKEVFKDRYLVYLENSGEFPDRFIK